MWHHDVTNAGTCQFSAVCLTVFPFEFRPRTFTIGFYGKNSIISELMILECSFPLRPAGSDPGVVCQKKILFRKLVFPSVDLALL